MSAFDWSSPFWPYWIAWPVAVSIAPAVCPACCEMTSAASWAAFEP
jgi:hypothetical protein